MITLASDFGDPYPAAMKGVIARRTDARTVDVSHSLPRQDVRSAAFWLQFILPEFPPAVHCVVVDPGVGTDRAALVVRAGDQALVGPDNGVLLPAAQAIASESTVPRVNQGVDRRTCTERRSNNDNDHEITLEVFTVRVEDPSSHTFHGRDVFAPVAADIHDVGVANLDGLPALSPTDEFEELRFPDPSLHDGGATGEVLAIDGFGNIITNIPGSALGDKGSINVEGNQIIVAPSYAHVDPSDQLVTVGSHGNVELAVNRGRGDDAFGLDAGDTIRLDW